MASENAGHTSSSYYCNTTSSLTTFPSTTPNSCIALSQDALYTLVSRAYYHATDCFSELLGFGRGSSYEEPTCRRSLTEEPPIQAFSSCEHLSNYEPVTRINIYIYSSHPERTESLTIEVADKTVHLRLTLVQYGDLIGAIPLPAPRTEIDKHFLSSSRWLAARPALAIELLHLRVSQIASNTSARHTTKVYSSQIQIMLT